MFTHKTCATISIALAVLGSYPDNLTAQGTPGKLQATNKEAITLASAYPNDCDVPNVTFKGTDLHYYPPFTPGANVMNVWCQMQTFKSKEPIKVWLVTKEDSTPLVKSNFLPDGTVQNTKYIFAYSLIDSIQHSGVNLYRFVQPMSALFGFPKDTPEGAYHSFTGDLQMEVKDVEIMGLPFSVTAYFQPNAALVHKYYTQQKADYLNIPLDININGVRVRQVVGFPWSLDYVQIRCTDPKIKLAAPEIKKAILQKYTKWITKTDVAEPKQRDQKHRFSEIDDGFFNIRVHEGDYEVNVSKAGSSRVVPTIEPYLEVLYNTSRNSPYNPWITANADLNKYKATIIEKQRQGIVKKISGKNPF